MQRCIIIFCLALSLTGCAGNPVGKPADNSSARINPTLTTIDLSSLDARSVAGGASLAGAKGECLSFALQIDGLPDALSGAAGLAAQITSLSRSAGSPTIDAANFACYQVVSLPVNLNRAGYIRQTGRPASITQVPRALLPVTPLPGKPGVFPLTLQSSTESIWIDLQIPPLAPAGPYSGQCRLIGPNGNAFATLPLNLTVYDFALPLERHLQMVGSLDLNALARFYPTQPAGLPANLLSRQNPACNNLVAALDAIEDAAQNHRTSIITPALAPTVKWPAGEPPDMDWDDFDSLVGPWLSGQAFSDKTPLGYWPIPSPDGLNDFDHISQQQYWSRSALHFTQQNWLTHSTVFFDQPADSVQQAAAAITRALAAHPLLNVVTRLNDAQLSSLSKDELDRVTTAADALVSSQTAGEPSRHWLRGNPSAYDQADVRLSAWLAYLRGADLVLWNGVLPDYPDPRTPGNVDQPVWFYPGSWFGLTHPVPSIQLAWLRRAQQDYEYLWLADHRGKRADAQALALLLTKPAEAEPTLSPDAVYELLPGTADESVWRAALQLTARMIQPATVDQPALAVDLAEWRNANSAAAIIPRSVQWKPAPDGVQAALAVDVFNASNRPLAAATTAAAGDASDLQIASASPAWHFDPSPTALPQLKNDQVGTASLIASYDLNNLKQYDSQPIQLNFQDGFTRRKTATSLVLPVAVSQRRTNHLSIDGRLDDWSSVDQIQNGPLVNFVDRPSLRRPEVNYAPTSTQLFTAWADENFYVAFSVTGVQPVNAAAFQNFIEYDLSRVWGDDLCQVLIQPIYPDNSVGPALHLVCKPSSVWIESNNGAGWKPTATAAVRYAATLNSGIWQGELAIPWKAILDSGKPLPKFLRFNFAQHQNQTGASSSWAGPLDSGRDQQLTGLLQLRN